MLKLTLSIASLCLLLSVLPGSLAAGNAEEGPARSAKPELNQAEAGKLSAPTTTENPVLENEATTEPAASALKTSAPKTKARKTPKAAETQPASKAPDAVAVVPATENFIVQATSMDVALKAVEGVGGTITHKLGIIDAVAADLTEKQIATLTEVGGVRLHANRRVKVDE